MYTSSCSGGGDSSTLSVLIQSQKGSCSSQPLDASFLSGPSPSPSPFLGIFPRSFSVSVSNIFFSAVFQLIAVVV